MKHLVIFYLLLLSSLVYSQKAFDSSCIQLDSIEVLFESIEPRNKILFTHFELKDSLIGILLKERNSKTAFTKIPTDKIYQYHNYIFYIWIKRRIWFGYKVIKIEAYCTRDKKLYIYYSKVHKYRYRYVTEWVDSFRLPI